MTERVSAIYRSLSHSSCGALQVRDLEERLVEKEHELKQMKRNLDESEGAIAQVNLIVFCLFFTINLAIHLPLF